MGGRTPLWRQTATMEFKPMPCRALPTLLRLWSLRSRRRNPETGATLTRLAAEATRLEGLRWLAARASR